MGKGDKDKDSEESAQLVGSTNDGESGADKKPIGAPYKCKEKHCGTYCVACCRCFFALILFPFVLLLTLLAFFVWVILLPGTFFKSTAIFLYSVVYSSKKLIKTQQLATYPPSSKCKLWGENENSAGALFKNKNFGPEMIDSFVFVTFSTSSYHFHNFIISRVLFLSHFL